jgi:hypothetical protein
MNKAVTIAFTIICMTFASSGLAAFKSVVQQAEQQEVKAEHAHLAAIGHHGKV